MIEIRRKLIPRLLIYVYLYMLNRYLLLGFGVFYD